MFNPIDKVIRTSNFSGAYPGVNEFLYGLPYIQESRYGRTREMMDVKLTLYHSNLSGIKRCVGGRGRDINVFFLLAEALWIWAGRKDVSFLQRFNGRIREFSDDGRVFHAPYGWRLRHWGAKAEEEVEQEGIDQIRRAVNLLEGNALTRQAVMGIWNPEMDLCTISKDIPCNDLVMFKIRNMVMEDHPSPNADEDALYMSIANRSNDFHWGLPTNIFQFSFIGELIGDLLGVKFFCQTHNIHSLHYYLDNEIAKVMHENRGGSDLYQIAKPLFIDIDWKGEASVDERLKVLDRYVILIIHLLEQNLTPEKRGDDDLKSFSKFFHFAYHLLAIYLEYTNHSKTDEGRMAAIQQILVFLDENPMFIDSDIVTLALNFFVKRIKDKSIIPSIIHKEIGSF